MRKKKILYILILFLVAFSPFSQLFAQPPKELVMEQKDLEKTLQEISKLVREMDENVANANMNAPINQATYQPQRTTLPQYRESVDAVTQYRFDRLENMLSRMMMQTGLNPAPTPVSNIIIDRTGSTGAGHTTPPYYIAPPQPSTNQTNNQSNEVAELQKQLDLVQEQLNILTSQLKNENLKGQLNRMANRLDSIKSNYATTAEAPTAEASTVPVTQLVTPSLVVRKDSIITDTVIIREKKNIIKEVVNYDEFNRQVFFEISSYGLTSEAKNTLNEVIYLMKSHPELTVYVVGSASRDGNKDFNEKLAHNRAKAVTDYLLNNNIAPSRLLTKNSGEDHDSDLLTYGRRVDVFIAKKVSDN